MRAYDGESAVKSPFGAFCSIILLLIMVGYTAQKTVILVNKSDTSVNVYNEPFYYSNEDEFGYENGLNMAFSIGSISPLPSAFDSRIGNITANLFTTKISGENFEFNQTNALLHQCSREELGLVEDSSHSSFYPIVDAQKEIL